MSDVLYGRNAVREALRARRRRFKHLSVAAGSQERTALADIRVLAEQAGVPIQHIDRRELDRQLRGANHQGVALHAGGYPYVAVADMLDLAAQRSEPALLLLLDHLQDPQNVGTLLRTAESIGIHGVVLPARRAVAVTPAVVNASSGATEHLPIATVSNLAQTIATLQQAGLWVVGLENDPAAQEFDQADLGGPLAFVLGAEGPGLARLTRDRCDFLVRLPLAGQIASLNAAVAGSIVLYHTWRQRSRHASI
jgi:23S rRNA (guanosine2251-2'-O)-methyltransferase